jgi:hypothetical protein
VYQEGALVLQVLDSLKVNETQQQACYIELKKLKQMHQLGMGKSSTLLLLTVSVPQSSLLSNELSAGFVFEFQKSC